MFYCHLTALQMEKKKTIEIGTKSSRDEISYKTMRSY